MLDIKYAALDNFNITFRFQREDLLAILLSQIEGSGSGIKRVPSYVAPDIAADIRRHFASTIRQRKGNFPCNFVTEFPTFTLPAGKHYSLRNFRFNI
ncbi:hypothetical protein NQ314_011308 [Rhamnusium bicolor]|uniref:Uncharacterized protein n=1 Tax=Rhamnusium bicolor TaxID=1586634 RepID=A0AAV8XIR3_9CUCU|nr:hypothetical protein NQ314_011308 [Rhamnusium bicolor]